MSQTHRIFSIKGGGSYCPTQALAVLEPLLHASRQTGRMRSTLRLMVQQAVTYYAIEDKEQALSVLGQVLSLAEPEGFVRTFVDEGQPMARLLYEALSRDRTRLCSAVLSSIPLRQTGANGSIETSSSQI